MLRRGLVICLVLVVADWSLQLHSQNDPWQAALSLERQGKISEAEAAWTALCKAHPTNPEPFAQLGLLEARQEHYSEAVVFYRKAIALDPAMPRLRFNLGLAYFKGVRIQGCPSAVQAAAEDRASRIRRGATPDDPDRNVALRAW
jgi:predicted Zn-dependent protease